MKRKLCALAGMIIFFSGSLTVLAEDGYRLWLRYDLVTNPQKLSEYQKAIKSFTVEGDSPTMQAAAKELRMGLDGLLGKSIMENVGIRSAGTLIATNYRTSKLIQGLNFKTDLDRVGDEGYLIRTSRLDGKEATIITANTDIGVMHGVFGFLRLLQV